MIYYVVPTLENKKNIKKTIACTISLGFVWFIYWLVSTGIHQSEVEISTNANNAISEMDTIRLRAVEHKVFTGEWPENLKALSEGEKPTVSTKSGSSYALDVSGDTLTVSFHDETKDISRAMKEKLGESVHIINEDKTITMATSQIKVHDIVSLFHYRRSNNTWNCSECAVLPEKLNTDLSVGAGEMDMPSLEVEKPK